MNKQNKLNQIGSAIIPAGILAAAILLSAGAITEAKQASPAGPSPLPKLRHGCAADVEMDEAYAAFLEGSGMAVTAGWYAPDSDYSGAGQLVTGQKYSLDDLVGITTAVYGLYWDGSYHWKLEYALLDSEDDGDKELAVRLNSVGIDGPDDTSSATFLLKTTEGELLLCDAFDTWSRGGQTQYYYGFREGGGSSGAGDHIYEACFMNGEGRKQYLYNCRTVIGTWMSSAGEETAMQNYSRIYSDYPEGMQMNIWTIGPETCYTYELEYHNDGQPPAGDQQMLAAMLDCFEEQGTPFVTQEDIDGLIAGRNRTLGIKEAWLEKKELEWHSLPVLCVWFA